MKRIIYLIFPFLLLSLSSCVSSYHRITSQSITLEESRRFGEVKYRYSAHLIDHINHNIYQLHARNKNIRLYAVEIENIGIEPIHLGRTHFFRVNGQPVIPLETDILHGKLKKNYSSFFPALLISPLMGIFFLGEDNMGQEGSEDASYAWAFLIGPTSLLISTLAHLGDDISLKEDLKTYNLAEKRIETGQKIWGIIGVEFEGDRYEDLDLYKLERY